MASLEHYQSNEFSPRRKIRYFQFALLRAARVLYNGPTSTRRFPIAGVGTNAGGGSSAGSASNIIGESTYTGYYITNVQYLAIESLFKRPWRKSTAASDMLSWVKGQGGGSPDAGGSGYIVGDELTIVQSGGANGRCVVANVNQTGQVKAVLPISAGTGYKPGRATVTGGTGTGLILQLTPKIGGIIDVMDQVRIDVQGTASGQSWYPNPRNSPTGTKSAIRDWGNIKSASGWLQSIVTNGTIFNGTLYNAGNTSVSAYSGGTQYFPGNLATTGGKTYMCYKVVTGTGPTTGIPPADPYWVILPNGGTANAGQLLCPIGVALASITGRLAAIAQGLV